MQSRSSLRKRKESREVHSRKQEESENQTSSEDEEIDMFRWD